MKRSPSPAKISHPKCFGVLSRDRLFRLLDQNRDQPLLWIGGPPGSGKTTLVASWLEARRLPSLWHQVDEGDNDPASFFYYLSLAAKKANPRKRKPLPFFTPEYQLGLPTFSRRFFENVFSRLLPPTEKNGGPFVMVFDNCQEVSPAAPFYEVLNAGVEHAPSGMTIIFISRNEPPQAFVRWRANSRMKTIGWDELRFTPEEAAEMVRLRGYEEVSAEVLGRLHAKTDGWAAGIVLSLESARNGGIQSALSRARAAKEIFQYFTREIFARTEPAVRDFLLKTSLLPLMSAGMAEALTGNRQAEQVLAELSESNYFTQRFDLEEPHYQYHALFRQFLRQRAGDAFGAVELATLRARAASILEQDGRPEDAIGLLHGAKAWTEAVDLILRHAPDLVAQGRSRTLEGWIEGLPVDVAQTSPWLLYWRGVCRLPFSPPDSRTLFEAAFNLFRAGRDALGIYLSLSGVFDSIAWTFSDYRPFDAALALLDEVMREYPDFPSVEIEARLLANKLFALVFRQPWHKELTKTAGRALAMVPQISDLNTKTLLLRCLLLHSIYFGEPQKAEMLFDLCRELLHAPHRAPLLWISLKNDEANYYRSRAEFHKGLSAVQEALELASATGVRLMDEFLLGQGAVAALELGQMDEADSFLDPMGAAVSRMPLWARSFYHHLRGWKSLVQGDGAASLAQMEAAVKLIVQVGVPHAVAHSRLVYALALEAAGKNHEARDHLARCHAFARRSSSRIIEFACLLAEARFAFAEGDDSCGLNALAKAFAIGRARGYWNVPYSWVPSMMADLCRRALDVGIEADYARRLVGRRRLMPDPPPIDCEQWPWALKIYTLGRFAIVRGDEAVQFFGKVQKRPLELLKFLIAGGGAASQEQIADCLWPDAAGDAAHSALKVTLSRLRRLLGVEGAIRWQEGKVSLDPRIGYVDAQAFLQVVGQFEKAVKDDADRFCAENSRVLEFADKAVAIYRGRFLLEDEEKFWIIPRRERLRSRFSSLVTRIGELLGKTGQWEKALAFYRRGVEVDELAEEFHQGLMICHRELGRRANAVEAYHHCRKLLAAKLGIEPSPKTTAIYKTL